MSKVYSKMTKFSNSSDIPKEMMYFTYDQCKQFISVETELQKKVMFKILYYCGLRKLAKALNIETYLLLKYDDTHKDVPNRI